MCFDVLGGLGERGREEFEKRANKAEEWCRNRNRKEKDIIGLLRYQAARAR